MLVFLGFLLIALFLFGLVQWARGGALLWGLLRLKRNRHASDSHTRIQEEAEIHKAEKATDHFLRSSFKVIGLLAVAMWLFLGLTVLLDLMGINWLDRISSRARTFWGSPVYNQTFTPRYRTAPQRQDSILKSLGNRLRP